jgi:tetratricopeptide (TPR) repeat protein
MSHDQRAFVVEESDEMCYTPRKLNSRTAFFFMPTGATPITKDSQLRTQSERRTQMEQLSAASLSTTFSVPYPTEVTALLPVSWPRDLPLARIRTCGTLAIEVLHEVQPDVAGQPVFAYGPPDERLLAKPGAATALILLALLASQPRGYAAKDFLSEHLRHSANSKEEDEEDLSGFKRVDNVVSLLRHLLCPPVLNALPQAKVIRNHLISTQRGSSQSGTGFQLAGLPLVWLDVEAIRVHLKRARSLEQFGQGSLAEWQAAYDLLAHGSFLGHEPYSDWATWRRQEVEAQWWDCTQVLWKRYSEQGETGQSEAMRMLGEYWRAHPTNEDALRPLLEQLAKREHFGQAEEYYTQLCNGLAEEGKEPDKRTQDVIAFVRAMRVQRQSVPQVRTLAQNGFVQSEKQQDGKLVYEDLATLAGIMKSAGNFIGTEAMKQLEGPNRDMDVSRRATIVELLGLIAGATLPLEWRERLAYSKSSHLTSDAYVYFQDLIENGWELSNVGEWDIAEQVLHSFLPDVIRHAVEQREAALLAAQGLVLRSILLAHQMKLSAMIPLCQQAVLYAKGTGDHTTICASLNGLAVAFKYNQQFDRSLQTYMEALDYCDKHASALIRSRIYAGAAAALARCGRNQEAEHAIHLAYDHFPEHPEQDSHFFSTDHGWYMIAYYQGLMHLAMNQPLEALKAFEQYEHHPPTNGVPRRNQLEIINHQGRAAILAHQLDLYASCLESGMSGALALNSKKRLDEAVTIFREEMPQSWQKEQPIKRVLEHYPMLLREAQ